jgi:drug/metabolite transporter (DMT)-like permease
MGFLLLAAVTCWAGGHLAVKKLSSIQTVQINFYYSLVLALTNGILYPLLVTDPVNPVNFLISIVVSRFPMALSTLFFVTALKINLNSGMTTMFVFNSVVVGYLLSIFRYNEKLNVICLLGSLLIVISLGKILIKDR